jgi:hypothetical protein
MSPENQAPYLFPKFLLSLIPASFAWQIYGFWPGLAVYVTIDALLVALGYMYLFWDWPFHWLVRARTTLILLSTTAISLSAIQTCAPNLSDCRWVLWSN